MSQEAPIGTPRIAFSTLAFPDADLATAVSLGRSWGYTGVELRLIDGELIDPAMLPEARAKASAVVAELLALAASGFSGYVSLEPHLAEAGRYGGFSGPQEFRRAVAALKGLLTDLSIPWQ